MTKKFSIVLLNLIFPFILYYSIKLVDFLSNGFKIRSTVANELNAPNETYIYAAFAESPFQYARAR